ncbi:MAG: YciI family protein [Phenylobacterium sp.]|jgi:hypothetical protein|uniref:YciI family protein n=1 Tax=Phenylobacterium sp. TaxID=1871053 RepID=UPI001A222D47|nr:YciI family protein [Phenylobacterium sp.]MBJ7411744.1 YciI family protein [Phenylobacterium sp.]
MRFMIIRKSDADTEAGVMPTEAQARSMIDYHAEMAKHLKVLGGDGLHPSSRGARVKFTDGKPMVIDGPFAETKELIAGYTMVEADSLEEVLEWARRWPMDCGEANVELEIRRVFELEELGDAFARPTLREHANAVFGKS